MQCWEKHNRYLVRDEDLAKGACLIAEDGLSLIAQLDIDGWPLPVYVMDDDHAAPDFDGDRFCHRFTFVSSIAEALEWFESMKVVRPWVARQ